MDFIKRFMNGAASDPAGALSRLCKTEGFYREKDGAEELLTKEEKGLFFRP